MKNFFVLVIFLFFQVVAQNKGPDDGAGLDQQSKDSSKESSSLDMSADDSNNAESVNSDQSATTDSSKESSSTDTGVDSNQSTATDSSKADDSSNIGAEDVSKKTEGDRSEEATIGIDTSSGQLSEATRVYLLGNASLEDKKKTIDHWMSVSKEAQNSGNYSKANDLAKALFIALPRLELVREIEDLKGNINAYEKLDGDVDNENYKSAKKSLDDVQKTLLDDGSSKIHVEVQKELLGAITKMMAILNDLSKEKPTKVIEGGNQIELIKESSSSYVVKLIPKRRESLWRIAEYKSIYGNPWKWKLIYEANKKRIKNPNLIYPGQKFIIPPLK